MSRWGRMRHHLYFVQCEVTGAVKIGVTGNLEDRITGLRCSSPTPLRLLHSVRGTARAERGLHLYFKVERKHGEWFAPSERLMKFVEELRSSTPAEVSKTLGKMRTPPAKRYQGGERGRQKRRASRLWLYLERLFASRVRVDARSAA